MLAGAENGSPWPLLRHDLEDPAAAHHVDEVPAPCRIEPRGDREDVLLLPENPVVRGEAADLRLLSEGEEIGCDAEALKGPHRAGETHAGLHLVEDEQHLVLVAECAHLREDFGAEMVVA